jgi:hypothetical protein
LAAYELLKELQQVSKQPISTWFVGFAVSKRFRRDQALTPRLLPFSARHKAQNFISLPTTAANMIGKMVGPSFAALAM